MSCLAIDIGASSGRHILFRPESGNMQEIYRFPNGMTEKNGHLCWDYDAIFAHILEGMRRCKELGEIPDSVGIDTWGVDFVLLDESDRAIGDFVGYRDSRTNGMDAEVSKIITPEVLYRRTGIQKAAYNTIYQLMALKLQHQEQLGAATTFLLTPDYLHWRLCGRKANEYTEASTSQLLNPYTRQWDHELIERLGFPKDMFCQVVLPGTILGELTPEVQRAAGFNCRVIAPATHDTASAVAAMPQCGKDTIFLSSGTWSLLGVERDAPDCSELENQYGFAELCGLAEQAEIASLVDCEDERFLAPKSMIAELQAACRESGQQVPQTPGELAAVVYRSLARCYGEAVRRLRADSGTDYRRLCVLGGGSNAGYLNRLTAEATGCTVILGPAEATAIGNAAVQMQGGALSAPG